MVSLLILATAFAPVRWQRERAEHTPPRLHAPYCVMTANAYQNSQTCKNRIDGNESKAPRCRMAPAGIFKKQSGETALRPDVTNPGAAPPRLVCSTKPYLAEDVHRRVEQLEFRKSAGLLLECHVLKRGASYPLIYNFAGSWAQNSNLLLIRRFFRAFPTNLDHLSPAHMSEADISVAGKQH